MNNKRMNKEDIIIAINKATYTEREEGYMGFRNVLMEELREHLESNFPDGISIK